jgi:glycosyltransferase A (GT-A) superfamily protein (DUF2064 family)
VTVVAVLLDPPRDGLVLPDLTESSPLSPGEATDLYRAMAADVLRAVDASGGDLLVNYRPDDDLPAEHRGEDSAEAAVRALAADALGDLGDVRFEVQVGSTPAARVGNTVTHLLDREGIASAAALRPDTPLVTRKEIDGAAMKLRRSQVVLGPSERGSVYYAGFADPIDFTDALDTPAVETLVRRARDADLDADFLAQHTRVRTGSDLATLLSIVRARQRAERVVPTATAEYLDDLDIDVRERDGEPSLVRE